jgi:hypothetical protein
MQPIRAAPFHLLSLSCSRVGPTWIALPTRKPIGNQRAGTRTGGAIRCKAQRQPWHLRQPWQCGICNLQNLKEARAFESHSLRQLSPIRGSSLGIPPAFAVGLMAERNRVAR